MPQHSWQQATQHGNIIRLLHQNNQAIQVLENDQYRWLEIDGVMQSLMKLSAPSEPVLPPHQAMIEVLPATEDHGVALELGLGGGAMQRYFQAHRPHWQLTSVELNPIIIELFKDHFQPEQPSLNTQLLGRAELTVAQLADQSLDALLVDVCTDEGIPTFLADIEFWQQVNRVLKTDATLAVNLIPIDQEEWERVTLAMRHTLELPLGWIQVPGHLNVVVVSAPE